MRKALRTVAALSIGLVVGFAGFAGTVMVSGVIYGDEDVAGQPPGSLLIPRFVGIVMFLVSALAALKTYDHFDPPTRS